MGPSVGASADGGEEELMVLHLAWGAAALLALAALACLLRAAGAAGPAAALAAALTAPARALARHWAAERRVRRVWRALESRLPHELREEIVSLSDDQLGEALVGALEPLLGVGEDSPALNLAIDIGGTRTKFMLQRGNEEGEVVLEPMLSRSLWQDEALPGEDKFDPTHAAERVRAHLEAAGVPLAEVRRVVFSVPGTVDIEEAAAQLSEPVQVRNMPSFSPRFRGFNFKAEFARAFPNAKISAIPDNMAAALGVACTAPAVQNALVVVLGTAPAVATFFRDPTKREKYIESAIWQSWAWFTKIDLADKFGYCGGLHLGDDGHTLRLRAPTEHKIPHHQARIRFALDGGTWDRLMGRSDLVPAHLQGGLSEEEATAVWCARLEAALAALALKFHGVYGPPDVVYVLGGNATRCHGRVTSTSYEIPDSAKRLRQTVPVVIPARDTEQMRIPLLGLLFSARYKVKHVFAPGQDPLARGWTRGGELYIWVSRARKRDDERPRAPSPARLEQLAQLAAGRAAAQPRPLALREQLQANATALRERREATAARAPRREPDSVAHRPRQPQHAGSGEGGSVAGARSSDSMPQARQRVVTATAAITVADS